MRRGFLVKRRSDDVHTDLPPAAVDQGQLPGMKRGFLLKPCTTKATAIPPATTAKSTETAATITAPSKLERDLRNGHLHPGSGGRGAKGTPLDTKRAAKQEHSGLPSPGSSGTPSVEDMPTLLRLPKPPLKCTICRYDIQSYEELFWVECWSSCQLYLHCPCLHYSLLALDMDPTEQLKMAKCYNSTCSAKFMSLCMCSIDYDGVPNIKYYAKLDIKGRIVSENYNVTPEQARKTTEEPHVDAKLPHCTPPSSVETENVEPADGKKEKKSKKKRKSSKSQTNKRSESQSTSERPNIQKHDDSMVPESTKDKMQDTISSKAHELEPVKEDVEVVHSPEYQESVVEDHEIPPLLSAVRVQPASELDAVPLLHSGDDDVEKNAVVEKPPLSSSKHAVERNRAASIEPLITDMNDVAPEEAHEHDKMEDTISSNAHELEPVEKGVEVVGSPEYQESVVEDREILPLLSAVRVQPASELDAVPLLHREDDVVEKNTIVEKPPISSSKHAVEGNRAASIDHLVTDMKDVTPEEAHEHDRSGLDDRSRSAAAQCPNSAEIQGGRRCSAVASSEMAPDCLTQLEEFAVRSLLQCVEPYSRQLAAYTPDYAQPIDRLKEAIETVVELHRYHQKLLDKVFSSDNLLRLFIHKLRIFVVSRTRGQVMFAKSNYAKVLEKKACLSSTISQLHVDKPEPRSAHPSSNNNGDEAKRILHGRTNSTAHGLSERSDDLKTPLKGIAAKCDHKKATSPLSRLPSSPWKTIDHSDKARNVAVSERTCQICLDTFDYDSQLLHCPNKSCGEPYHAACVRPWLAYQAKCPQCRWSWPDPVDFPEMCAAGGIQS